MSSPTGPVADPQADIETQPIPVVVTEVGSDHVNALQEVMRAAIEDVVQRQDVEHLEKGDKMVSGSGTVREVIEKKGPYHFICLTTKSYEGSKRTHMRFRKTAETMAANMTSAELFRMNPGETIYGPDGEKMIIKSIIRGGNGHGDPYGIEVIFEEDIQVDPDSFGKWLVQIIKKDTAGE